MYELRLSFTLWRLFSGEDKCLDLSVLPPTPAAEISLKDLKSSELIVDSAESIQLLYRLSSVASLSKISERSRIGLCDLDLCNVLTSLTVPFEYLRSDACKGKNSSRDRLRALLREEASDSTDPGEFDKMSFTLVASTSEVIWVLELPVSAGAMGATR
jgi:hypothetical protein